MKGFIISGTGSGVGKTSIATGIMSILSKKYKVQAFKTGPDFIDPMYHSVATGRPCKNIDSFMMTDDTIRKVVGYSSKDADLCIVEGVRGLFEGYYGDSDEGSTAYVAKLLDFPVVLVVNVASLTRSAAAIINGFRAFDPDLDIAGVILNNVSGRQHSTKLVAAIEHYCDVEILGLIPKSKENTLEQRYLGLRTLSNYDSGEITPLQNLVEPVDTDRLMNVAERAKGDLSEESPFVQRKTGLTVGVPMDDSYCFYYRDNLECLESSGFSVRHFKPTEGDSLPDADCYYLGGGYPELYAEKLAQNRDYLEGLKNASEEGKTVIAECGGLMTLCSSITGKDGAEHRMSGVFDAKAVMTGVRHGPTYVISEATADNPVFKGRMIGHEYHYSDVFCGGDCRFGYALSRGTGICDMKDGLVKGKAVGSYMHQHALSKEDWAGDIARSIS